MLAYRIRLLSPEGAIEQQWTAEYPSDDEAIDQAGRLSHPHRIQLLQFGRLVGEFPAEAGLLN